jgi:PAS domain S-box-containing protein
MERHCEDGRERVVNRYETILGAVDDAVFVVDTEWSIEYANEGAAAEANTTRDALVGTPVMALTEEMVVGRGVEKFEEALEAAFADGEESPATLVLELDLSGDDQFVEYRLSPMCEGEAVTGVAIVARDVTERKRREDRIRNLTEEYEAIFEHTQDAIFLVDVRSSEGDFEFRVERLNPAYESITGLTTDEARGKTPRELLGDDLGATVEEKYRRCVETGEPVTYEETFPMPEGSIVAQTNLAPVTVEGAVTQIVGIAREVTERAKRERRLERREEQLRGLHDATRDLLGADTAERAAEIASAAASDILDLRLNGIHFHDEAAGGLVPVAVSDASRELLDDVPVIDDGLAWEAFQRGDPLVYEDVREAENVYDVETPVRSEMHLPLGEHGVFIVSSPTVDAFDDSDVDLARTLAANTQAALARISQERELRTREAELEGMNERLDRFASVVSHDLRNPLSVASGHLELARQEGDSDHLEAASTAIERMEALISNLLALARKGKPIDGTERVVLSSVAEQCWGVIDTQAATLTVGADGTFMADPDRLQQLLENLFRNAVEHGSTSGRPAADDAVEEGREGVTIRVEVLPDRDALYVADDGPGIPEGEREEVFEFGYSTAEGGTGFGLAIAREIADAHGWDIGVTAGADGGARFEITGVEFVE